MAAPLSTTLLVTNFMGRERAPPLAGGALHYHKRTAEGCVLATGAGRGPRSELETEHSHALFMLVLFSGASTDALNLP